MDFQKYVGQAIATSTQMACSITDLDATFVYVNDAFCNLYACTKEDLLGKSVSVILDENTAPKAIQQHKDYLLNDVEPSQSWEVFSIDGELIRISTSVSKFVEEDQPYMLAITTKLGPEQAIEGDRLKIGSVDSKANAGRYIYRPKENYLSWSEGLYEIFNHDRSKDPLTIQEQLEYLSQADAETLEILTQACLEEGKPFDYAFTLNFPDGHFKHIRLFAELEDHDIEKASIIGVVLDITSEVRVNRELEHANKLNELAVKGGNIGIWELDLATGASNFNSMWYEMLGYEKSDITFTVDFFGSLLHPDDKEIPFHAMEEYLSGKTDKYEITIRLRAKDGSYRWVFDKASIVEWDKDGKPKTLAGSHIDITDLKNAEKSLIESEIRYRFLSESLPHILWTADENGALNYCNQYGLDYLGARKEDIATWEWVKYIHPEDVEDVVTNFSKAIEKGTAYINEQRLKSKEGDYRWFRVTAYPLKDRDGLVKSWVGLSTDVHEAISSRAELEKTNNRLRSLIDASPIAIYSITPDGIVNDFWNPAAEILLGWKKEDALGKFLPHVREEHHPEFNTIIDTIKDGKEVFKKRIVRHDKQGNEIHIELTAGPIYEKGEINEILILTSDVSELEQKSIELEDSLKEKETLLQEIHHRVKNNLAVVSGLLHLQAFGTEEEEHKSKLTIAQNRIQTIAVVHELLYKAQDFSKINLSDYYEQLINLIELNLDFDSNQITTEFNVEVSYFNINQAIPLGLLLNELLTNSIKYAFSGDQPDKKLRIDMRQSGDDITLIYEDNGPGFDLDEVRSNKTVGWELMKTLVDQLNATADLDTSDRFYLKLEFKNALEGKGAYSNMLIK